MKWLQVSSKAQTRVRETDRDITSMNRVAGPLVGLVLLSGACATPQIASFDPDMALYSIPIGDFDGYDPYPPGASGAINAYVNFAEDGLLRASLGCATMGAPYTISEDRRLIILNDEGLSKHDYTSEDCADHLIEKEKSLARFLESQPKISGWTANGRYLKTRRKTLLLQSVAHVLDIDTTMKVND